MNENGFNNLVKSLFMVIMVVFFLSMFLMISIYSKGVLSVNKDKIKHVKLAIMHGLQIEERFFIEEFFSESYEAIDYRVDRLLSSQGIKKYQVFINNSDGCLFSSVGCDKKGISSKDRELTLSLPIRAVSKEYGVVEVKVPLEQFQIKLDAFDHLKLYLLPLCAILGLYFLWSKVIDRNIIQPYLKKLILAEKKIAISKVSRQVAHDIRSPLAVFESVVESSGLERAKAKLLHSAIDRMKIVSNQLLENQNHPTEAFDLHEAVRNVVRLKNLEFEKQATVSFFSLPKKYIVKVDQGVFKSIVCNLVNNSVEAYPPQAEHKSVEIHLQEEGGFVVLKVKDFGKGVPSHIKDKVFEEGFTTKSYGNGLGLSQIKSLTEKCGGWTQLISGDLGTSISICLPLEKEESIPFLDGKESLTLVNIDDDPFYREKFFTKLKSKANKVVTHSCFENFKDIDEDCFFFIDYDLNKDKSGLDFIKTNNLQANSILLTNMAEDLELIKSCEKFGVRLISKASFYSDRFFVENINETKGIESFYH